MPITILYITNQICGSGGLERVLSIKANYLVDKLGYEVHISTLNQNDAPLFYKFSKRLQYHDIKIRSHPITYFQDYLNGINAIIKRVRPDIISVCDDGLKGLLFPILFGKNIPLIYERHASIELNFSLAKKPSLFGRIKKHIQQKVMLYGARKFNRFVILTDGNRKDWPNVNCTVIPNPSSFVLEDDFKNNSEQTVLAVGSQSYNKGYDRMIEMWKLVYEKYPNWKLEIYGKKNEELKLRQKADQLGLNGSLKFHEPVKQIQEKYKKASIYIMTSRSEGFGMVLIEAMSYQTPCIAFDCPHGPSDIIIEGENGFLIRDGDIKSFANKLMELINNTSLRNKMGLSAKSSVSRYYPGEIVNRWDKLFQSLMN